MHSTYRVNQKGLDFKDDCIELFLNLWYTFPVQRTVYLFILKMLIISVCAIIFYANQQFLRTIYNFLVSVKVVFFVVPPVRSIFYILDSESVNRNTYLFTSANTEGE